MGGPVDIHATVPQAAAFEPQRYEERAGLLLLNGVVYTSWASHCDFDPYNGWIIGYSATTLKQTAALNITPHGKELSLIHILYCPVVELRGWPP